MDPAKVTNGEPGALATGVPKCLLGQVLQSSTPPARLSEPVVLSLGDLNHANSGSRNRQRAGNQQTGRYFPRSHERGYPNIELWQRG